MIPQQVETRQFLQVIKTCGLMFCMFLGLHPLIFCQQNNSYFFRHITYNDGLLHNDVYDIVQDKKGFMWLATAKGLQRYDGSRFLGFNDMLNDPAASRIGHAFLNLDSAGKALWIRKIDELEKLELPTNRIRGYHPDEYFAQSSSRYSRYKGQAHTTWLVSDQAVFLYDSISKKNALYGFGITAADNHAFAGFIADQGNGESWLCTASDGIVLFDKKTMEMYSVAHNPTNHPLLRALPEDIGASEYRPRSIMKDSRNNVWIATWDSAFYRFDYGSGKLNKYSLATIARQTAGKVAGNIVLGVSGIYEDNHHQVWICTDNAGLLQYDTLADLFRPVLINNNHRENNLSGYSIFCITQDREENLWLGTNKGILLFNPYQQYFNTVHYDDMNPASLPPNEIECYIQTPAGEILVGTWGGGMAVYDSLWRFKKNIGFAKNKPVEYNFVWAFAQNDDGDIWAGLQHGYIHIYNPGTRSVQTIHPPEMENSTIRTMKKDSSGNIWMGLHNGKLVQWNKAGKRFVGYKDIAAPTMSRLSPVLTIFFDGDQRCWVGTEFGLKLFDTQTGQYTKEFLPDKKNPQAITANSITAVAQVNDATLLIGTLFGGLNFMDIKKEIFSHPVFDDSMKYNSVHAIKVDSSGNSWFTTDYGLFRFRPGEYKVTSYRIEKDMLNSAFKDIPFYTLQDGRWVSCTSTEIVNFHTASMLQEASDIAEVAITGIKCFDSNLPVDSLLQSKNPLRLSYKQNFITVEFSKLSFGTLHPFNYYYRLKGVSNEWVNAGKQSSVSFNNLAPGSYTFEVKEGETDSSKKITSFDMIIAPPFWKTWWFKSFLVLCMVACVYLFIWWRMKNFRAVETEKLKVQEAKIEMLGVNEKLAAAKLEALRSQMNPHFIFNCLASIDNLIQKGQNQKAASYLSRFAKLMRSVLETSQRNAIACWKDMETLGMYLEMEEMRSDKKLHFTVDIAKELMEGDYKVPPLVIQPFVENAIQHGLLNKLGADKKLQITVSLSGQSIRYIIEDNGVGRAKAAAYQQLNKPEHHSMGMQIAIDRINLYNKNQGDAVSITDLYDAQKKPAGTKIEVNINLQS